jgi:hypothetical protein
MTPAAIKTLLKQGFREVLVEKGAGEASEFSVSAKHIVSRVACHHNNFVTVQLCKSNTRWHVKWVTCQLGCSFQPGRMTATPVQHADPVDLLCAPC